MAYLIDRIIASAVPSYNLSIGNGLLFNGSDVGEDEGSFMVSRLKLADAVKDRSKMDTVSVITHTKKHLL
jgi:hypothetical protein